MRDINYRPELDNPAFTEANQCHKCKSEFITFPENFDAPFECNAHEGPDGNFYCDNCIEGVSHAHDFYQYGLNERTRRGMK